jgi:dynein heavy chain
VNWISGFFFAQSFMTAALQNYARRRKLAIDGIGFDFFMLDSEPTEVPAEGAYIKGLFVEGCAWDPVEKILCESKPKILMSIRVPSKHPPSHWTRRGVAMLCNLND